MRMMLSAALAALLALIVTAPAMAQAEPPKQPAMPPPAPIQLGGNARAEAWVAPSGKLFGRMNVRRVHHVADGTYCVVLDRQIRAARAIAVVTPDWQDSPDQVLLAMFRGHSICGGYGNALGVITGALDSGTFVHKDEAFTFVVP